MAFFGQDQQWYWAVVVVSMGAAYWKKQAGPIPAISHDYDEESAGSSSAVGPLPDEVIRGVLDYVDAVSLATSAASVCRSWQRIAENDDVWLALWLRDFSEAEDALESIQGRRTRHPQKALKVFYSQYSVSWLERALVGSNVENTRVHVGLHGNIYDVTDFCRRHPGSPETLLEFAGSDATLIFEDVGHSTDARKMVKDMLVARGPRTGALASVKHQYDAGKLFVSSVNRRTVGCPACDTLLRPYAACRPFWDTETRQWCVWWSCCGLCRDVIDQPPHDLYTVQNNHNTLQQQLLVVWGKSFLSSNFLSQKWNLSTLKSKYMTDFRILRS